VVPDTPVARDGRASLDATAIRLGEYGCNAMHHVAITIG
jgi:hypothetical protein